MAIIDIQPVDVQAELGIELQANKKRGTKVQFKEDGQLYKAYRIAKALTYHVIIDPRTKMLFVLDEVRKDFFCKLLRDERVEYLISVIEE